MNNKNKTRTPNAILGTVIGLLLVAGLQAAERDFPALERLIEQEAADKKLPMLSIILVDADGVAWSSGTCQMLASAYRAGVAKRQLVVLVQTG